MWKTLKMWCEIGEESYKFVDYKKNCCFWGPKFCKDQKNDPNCLLEWYAKFWKKEVKRKWFFYFLIKRFPAVHRFLALIKMALC